MPIKFCSHQNPRCYDCWLEAHPAPPPIPCGHYSGCFINKDGNVECPCGMVIWEEMGS